jgi:hypothetical protein
LPICGILLKSSYPSPPNGFSFASMKNKLISKGDKLDKYRAHLIEGVALDAQELEMLRRYRRAIALLENGETLRVTTRTIQSELNLSDSQAYAIVGEAKQLYGNIQQVDKEGMRYLHYENYIRLAKIAEDAGDFKTAKNARDSASRLYGLFAKDNKPMGLNPMDFMKATSIILDSDPEFFKQQQKEETEDIEYEDASDNILEQ